MHSALIKGDVPIVREVLLCYSLLVRKLIITGSLTLSLSLSRSYLLMYHTISMTMVTTAAMPRTAVGTTTSGIERSQFEPV